MKHPILDCSLEFLSWLEKQDGGLLLESSLPGKENSRVYLFHKPAGYVRADSYDAVIPAVESIRRAVDAGMYAAGFVAYEAGYAFEDVLRCRRLPEVPLIWMGLYDQPVVFNVRTREIESGGEQVARILAEIAREECRPEPPPEIRASANLTEREYADCWKAIHEHIVKGDTYQVNFTFKLKFPYAASPAALYRKLRSAQPVPYGAFINAGRFQVLSCSPELFFRISGSRITLRPMKGTAARGRTRVEDSRRRRELKESIKNRAENLMIVDLLRNDVGRIAETGSVRVKRFFEIEKYSTVFQATSTIQARLSRKRAIPEIIRSLFPCGSVTGAPKIRTMQIIRELEKEPRGVYTGGIGFFGPSGESVFSVAIRTVVLDRELGLGEMGVGSGLVYDSEAAAEYDECLLKGRFLGGMGGDFELFETIRWDRQGGWFLLAEHFDRLRASARHFNFTYSRRAAMAELGRCAAELRAQDDGAASYRVRLTLGRDGRVTATSAPLEYLPGPVRLMAAHVRVDSAESWLRHKTSRRELYDEQLRLAQEKGCFDAVFLNERGEVTEGARSNIVVRRGNEHLTPPVECGLLPGTFRAHLLRSGEPGLKEQVLHWEDLLSADEIYVCNALRGLLRARLEPDTPV